MFSFKYLRNFLFRKKEQTPLIPSQDGNKKSGLKKCFNTTLFHFSKEELRKVSNYIKNKL